jgi:hypothetical protein
MSTEFYNRNWRMPNSWNGSTDNNNKVSNYSMSFDGSSEYIDIPNGVTTPSIYTVSAWINSNDITSSGAGYLVSTSDNKGIALYEDGSGDAGKFYYWNASSATVISTTAITINNWFNVVFIINETDNEIKFYLNGSLDKTTTVTSISGNINRIGEFSGHYINAKLDHVAIFDYALSASQITTLVGNSTNGVGNPMSLSAKPKAFYAIGDYAAFNGTDYLVNNGALQDYNLKINPANLNQGFVISEDYGYSAFTISMWVNQDFVGRTIWVNEDTTGANTEKISISINANSFLVFNCQGGGDSYTLSTQHNLTGDDRLFGTNRWINITAVYTGTDMILYGNANSGNFVSVSASNYPAGGTVPSSITLAQNQTIIGKANLAGLSEFRGQLSNFSVFDAALPETGNESATSLFNNGTPANISSYSNLKGWWQFNADSTFDSAAGIWTSPDSSSNNNSAVGNFPNSWEKMQASYLVQSTLLITQPYSRYALSFDGTNDYIDCGTSSDLEITGDVSISAWVYIATGSAYQGIVAKRDSGGTNYQLYTDNSSTPKLRFYDGSTVTSSTGTVSLNAWHHVAITVDSGVTNGSIFYIDGVASGTATFTITSNDAPIIIGALNNGSFGSFLNGKLSNCSIWNAALTSAQVTEIYNQRKPSNLNNHSAYSNLVSWWQLGENSSFDGTNWTVLDEKGTANGTSVDMGEAAIVNGVGTSGNGVTDNMGADENIVGEAPYSTANAISYGMPVTARVSGSGNTPT